jgi:hypothetical protein
MMRGGHHGGHRAAPIETRAWRVEDVMENKERVRSVRRLASRSVEAPASVAAAR